MLSPIDALKLKLKSFFKGVGVFSNSIIIGSDMEETEFKSIWEQEKENFIKEHPDRLKDYKEVIYNSKITPKAIFDFLNTNNSSIIFFSTDEATKILQSTACLKIIEGAVCSSPDSGSKWSVHYADQNPFIFYGHLIMNIKAGSIQWNLSKYHYLARDAVIADLNKSEPLFGEFNESI